MPDCLHIHYMNYNSSSETTYIRILLESNFQLAEEIEYELGQCLLNRPG